MVGAAALLHILQPNMATRAPCGANKGGVALKILALSKGGGGHPCQDFLGLVLVLVMVFSTGLPDLT